MKFFNRYKTSYVIACLSHQWKRGIFSEKTAAKFAQCLYSQPLTLNQSLKLVDLFLENDKLISYPYDSRVEIEDASRSREIGTPRSLVLVVVNNFPNLQESLFRPIGDWDDDTREMSLIPEFFPLHYKHFELLWKVFDKRENGAITANHAALVMLHLLSNLMDFSRTDEQFEKLHQFLMLVNDSWQAEKAGLAEKKSIRIPYNNTHSSPYDEEFYSREYLIWLVKNQNKDIGEELKILPNEWLSNMVDLPIDYTAS